MKPFDLTIQTADPIHIQIERFLRNQIQCGHLRAEDRLPTTNELAQQWHVDQMSIQKAMTSLVRDGLVYRIPRRGTFVKSAGEQKGIGIFIGATLTNETAHFYRAMVRFLTSVINQVNGGQWQARIYDGLTEVQAGPDPQNSALYKRLAEDVRYGAIKGIIEMGGFVHDLRELQEAGLPVSSWGRDVFFDLAAFARDCVELAARRGIRRMAYLRTIGKSDDSGADLRMLREAVASMGLPFPEIYELKSEGIMRARFESAVHKGVLRLMDCWQERGQWPEALLISDDIGARAAAVALLERGVHVPSKLTVMVMANEGIEHHYAVPVVRHVQPLKETARILLEILRLRMRGESGKQTPIRLAGSWAPFSVEESGGLRQEEICFEEILAPAGNSLPSAEEAQARSVVEIVQEGADIGEISDGFSRRPALRDFGGQGWQ
ncbi:MAG: GntR family transcriptional regulator [Verrucomicrobiae bacterium]|nr:GntR family transcriptional regulator [Verrucomicrobiae bacterium]